MQNQPPHRQRSGSSRVSTFFVIALVGLAVFVVLRNSRTISDYLSAATFTPSSAVEQIMTRDRLTDTGRLYVKASRTSIANSGTFRSVCNMGQTEKTVILGCYRNGLIYVYNVTNTQLDGIKEVTAAHEMLHAAYDRLDAATEKKVNAMLEAAYASLNDPELTALMDEYKKLEPDALDNELHSILATQVASLPADLEAYYKRYFSDRSVVVGYYDGYEQVFRALKSKQDGLVADLDTLADQINSGRSKYETALTTLNADIEAFNSRASNGTISQSQFYSQRSSLQARADALDAERVDLNNKISLYTQKKSELDSVNLEAEALNKSIDSTTVDPTQGIQSL